MLRGGRCPPQSPAPGFGEKYWSLSGFPSHSLESGGGAFLIVIFGQIFAYSAFSDSHFSSPGSVSGLIASTGHSCVYQKLRPFDLVTESLNVSDDGRAAMLLIDAASLAIQVETPT